MTRPRPTGGLSLTRWAATRGFRAGRPVPAVRVHEHVAVGPGFDRGRGGIPEPPGDPAPSVRERGCVPLAHPAPDRHRGRRVRRGPVGPRRAAEVHDPARDLARPDAAGLRGRRASVGSGQVPVRAEAASTSGGPERRATRTASPFDTQPGPRIWSVVRDRWSPRAPAVSHFQGPPRPWRPREPRPDLRARAALGLLAGRPEDH